jgi:hypothetical protein
MKLQDIKTAITPVSGHILKMFDATQEEFTDRTVQEGFKYSERNKVQKLVKTAEFWEGYKLNLTKLSVDFKEGFLVDNPKATKEEKTKAFFSQLDKYSRK